MVAPVANWQGDVRDDRTPVIPSQIYHLMLGQVEPVSTRGGKVAINLHWLVQEPTEYAGSPFRDMAVLGSDDDPKALKAETQKGPQGWGTVKRVVGIIYGGEDKVPPGDPVAILQQCVGHAVAAHFTIEKDNDQTSQYFGNEQNRIKRYYVIGEKQVGTMKEDTKLTGAKAGTSPPSRPSGPPSQPAAASLPNRPSAPPSTVPQQEGLSTPGPAPVAASTMSVPSGTPPPRPGA